VSLLGEDSESLQNLEQSVQGILRRANALEESDVQKSLDTWTRQRHSARAEMATARRQLREYRAAEIDEFVVSGTTYHGTGQAIAKRQAEDANQCGWIPDSVSENQDAPLSDDEFAELCRLRQESDLDLLELSLPPLEGASSAESVAEAVTACDAAEKNLNETGGPPSGDHACLLALDEPQLAQLLAATERFVRLSEDLRKRSFPNAERIWRDVCNGKGTIWNALAATTERALSTLAEVPELEGDTRLEIPDGVPRSQVSADAGELLAHLKSGGRFGFWVFRADAVKRTEYLWQEARFRGQRCSSVEVLEALVRLLTAEELLDRTWREWGAWVKSPAGTLTYRLNALKWCSESLRKTIELGNLVKSLVSMGAPSSGVDDTKPVEWGQALLRSTKSAQATLALRRSVTILSGISQRLEKGQYPSDPHRVVNDLKAAVDGRNVAEYRKARERLAELHAKRSSAERCMHLDRALMTAAPQLADFVETRHCAALGDDLPNNFARA
jgi:hypothetical protein